MFRALRQQLTEALRPPVFEDPEQTRVAGVLHHILVGLLVLMACALLANLHPGVAPNPLPAALNILAVPPVVAVSLFLLRRGKVRAAGLFFSWTTWVIITGAAVCFGGVTGPIVAVYVVTPVVSGFFLGWRSVVGFGVLTALAGGAMAFAAYQGWMPQPLSPITPANGWISLLVGLSMTAYLLHMALRSTEEALDQAHENERAAREATRAVQSGRALLEVRARQQAAVASLGKEALSGAPVAELGASLVESVVATLEVPMVGLLELRDGMLHARLAQGPEGGAQPPEPASWPLRKGTIVGEALLGRQSVVVQDLERDDRFPHVTPIRQMGVRSSICVPIEGPKGPWGAVSIYDRVPDRFTPDDVHFIQSAIHLLGLALRREHDERQARAHELELRQAQKMEAVGLLAGGIAHDFNNLLTAIAGHNALLADSLGPESPQREDTEEIRRASERAASLTQQLLAFSRRQVTQPQVMDLDRIVEENLGMLGRLIGEDIELGSDLAPGAKPIRADRTQIEQVLLNLAVNARDSMPVGGQLVLGTRSRSLEESQVSGLPAGQYAVLEVSDTGVGMDEATRSRIFEPFFTTKDRFKGTGLGLSTVYGIVQQSSGAIEVESAPDKGSTFRIFLPLSEEPLQELATGSLTPAAPGHETVLLAEDDRAVRRLIQRTLERDGYQVICAAHGGEALEAAAAHGGPIDLLVTDVIMPSMGGAELARRMRERHPGLRVLFVSGYADDMLGQRGIHMERAAFLAKPMSPEDLTRKVREVLDGLAEPAGETGADQPGDG